MLWGIGCLVGLQHAAVAVVQQLRMCFETAMGWQRQKELRCVTLSCAVAAENLTACGALKQKAFLSLPEAAVMLPRAL
jgi:hypothetical protein